ncbi:alcohol dehydrogenase [bacterium DOLJORAL78_65_58]|nr:MAG: alcohol dehydrogenase [bacterium DOLZORAL124_64_63]PIE76103.1 MAG: alcohol dehydrogenase [bacterium DOLJORAL78_65_58]
MKQIVITGKGGTEKLRIQEAPLPDPTGRQVRVRVEAAGVNFADVMMRLGLYPDAPKPPAVPGYEVAGTVDAVGPEGDESLVGRPVLAMCDFGGYSEAVCLPPELVHPRPAGMDAVTGAALPVNFLTAWQMVRVMAPVAAGDRVLVHGAAGGVGQAVVQLGKLAGAELLGSASPSKHALLREQGLSHVFDSRQRDFAAAVKEATGGLGVDVALEPRNGPWIMESYASLAKCGRLVLFGFSHAAVGKGSGVFSALRTLAGVPWLKLNPIRLMNDNKSVAGVNLGRMWDMAGRTHHWVEALLELAGSGKIAPRIDTVLPFARVGEAHSRLEERRNVGKVVLVPDALFGTRNEAEDPA